MCLGGYVILQLPPAPQQETGEGGGPKGTREELCTCPLLSPDGKFWGNKFAWPHYWKLVGKSGRSTDFGVNLICIWMEAQSSFTSMIFVSISPSTTWRKGLETLRSPNSTWTKQLSYTKGNIPCSQQFFQHRYYMDMKFSSLVLRALESEEGWSKPGSPTKLTTTSPKPGRLSSAALNPSIHFPRGFLGSWRHF